MPVCEELAAAAINGVSYGPSCSCPAGFANMKYSDYNQPWSHHGGCSSIPHDKQGAFVDYKPCNGRQTCNYLDTPFCCGFDDVECELHYKGRCVLRRTANQLWTVCCMSFVIVLLLVVQKGSEMV